MKFFLAPKKGNAIAAFIVLILIPALVITGFVIYGKLKGKNPTSQTGK